MLFYLVGLYVLSCFPICMLIYAYCNPYGYSTRREPRCWEQWRQTLLHGCFWPVWSVYTVVKYIRDDIVI